MRNYLWGLEVNLQTEEMKKEDKCFPVSPKRLHLTVMHWLLGYTTGASLLLQIS